MGSFPALQPVGKTRTNMIRANQNDLAWSNRTKSAGGTPRSPPGKKSAAASPRSRAALVGRGGKESSYGVDSLLLVHTGNVVRTSTRCHPVFTCLYLHLLCVLLVHSNCLNMQVKLLHEISDDELLHEMERRHEVERRHAIERHQRPSLSAPRASDDLVQDQSPALMVSQQTPGRGDVGKKHVTPARIECLRVEDEEKEGVCDGVGASFHTKPQALTQSQEDTNVLGVQQDVAYMRPTKRSDESGHGHLVLSPPQFVVRSATFHEPVPCVAHHKALAPSNLTVARDASGAHPGAPQPAQHRTHFDHPEALVGTRQCGAGQGGGNNSPSSTPLATTKQAPQPSAATREMKAANMIQGAVRYRLALITLGLMRQRRTRLSEQEAMAEVMSKCESVREKEIKRASERASERERERECVCV